MLHHSIGPQLLLPCSNTGPCQGERVSSAVGGSLRLADPLRVLSSGTSADLSWREGESGLCLRLRCGLRLPPLLLSESPPLRLLRVLRGLLLDLDDALPRLRPRPLVLLRLRSTPSPPGDKLRRRCDV